MLCKSMYIGNEEQTEGDGNICVSFLVICIFDLYRCIHWVLMLNDINQ